MMHRILAMLTPGVRALTREHALRLVENLPRSSLSSIDSGTVSSSRRRPRLRTSDVYFGDTTRQPEAETNCPAIRTPARSGSSMPPRARAVRPLYRICEVGAICEY